MLGLLIHAPKPTSALRRLAAAAVAAVGLGSIAPLAQSTLAAAGVVRTMASTTERSGGCGLPPAPGPATLSIRLAGRARTVLVDVPTGYVGTTPVPLVVNLQGNRSSATGEASLSGMDAEAEQAGFIVAYPQALVASGPGFSWNDPGGAVATEGPDDLAFLTALPGALEARYCIDSTRVYLTGFGAGAGMAAQVACDDSNIYAALAAVSGLHWPASCPAIRPLAVIAFQGSADRIDAVGAGRGTAAASPVAQAARAWAGQDGCGSRPLTVVPAAGARLTAYVRCRAKVAVELYTVLGQGHEWPGGPPLPRSVTDRFGAQSGALDANQLIWAFFESHRLP